MNINATDLGSLIDLLPDGLDRSHCIFATEPWGIGSSAIAVPLTADYTSPQEVLDRGFVYFLEVDVAIEVLGAFGERIPSKEEKTSLLVYLALRRVVLWQWRRDHLSGFREEIYGND